MEKSKPKKYRLLKDLPSAPVGTVLTLNKQGYYLDEDWSFYSFNKEIVEKNADWFEEVEEEICAGGCGAVLYVPKKDQPIYPFCEKCFTGANDDLVVFICTRCKKRKSLTRGELMREGVKPIFTCASCREFEDWTCSNEIIGLLRDAISVTWGYFPDLGKCQRAFEEFLEENKKRIEKLNIYHPPAYIKIETAQDILQKSMALVRGLYSKEQLLDFAKFVWSRTYARAPGDGIFQIMFEDWKFNKGHFDAQPEKGENKDKC